MSDLPIGTVTFLLTDIEGSTALWEERSGEMRAALARHDAQLRQAVEASGGRIVKTTGDGVVAVFHAARDAVAAGVAAQRALQEAASAQQVVSAEPSARQQPIALKVRMGLHTGVAELRDEDYFGTPLNRAARIMSVAHGEQILLSAASAELVRQDLPDGVTLREMGEHRLKGLLNPERLVQVIVPGLRADFPPLASQTGHNLPAERDAFVGRRESLDDLRQRFATGRLVSLLGIGGTGKTRLAAQFGWQSLDRFPGGVWFCDVTQARTLDGILHAVAEGLDVPLDKDDAAAQLGHAIAGRGQCLLIIDNFEQVARYAEETLGRWLDRASAARFLVTTREVLGLPGEQIVALAPLPPSDGVELFMRRAEAAKPGFAPSAVDVEAIPLLVKLLEGMPLAIELAAARVSVMPPRGLLARMTDRFKLLASSGRRMDRQATLRGVFDWSWDLLSLPEKATLAQLSVFEGGFALEAVEAVLDLSAYPDAPWLPDALQSLVHKSLVRQATDVRFDLLVSVQEYAAEHLRTEGRYAGSGPAGQRAAETRHGAYFAGLDESRAFAEGVDDLENVVSACRRAAARGDADMAAKALQLAWAGLYRRGPFHAGVELAALVAAIPNLAPGAAARVDLVAGSALSSLGKRAEGRGRFEAALAGARATGDRECECRVLESLAFFDIQAGRLQSARTDGEASLRIARELNNAQLQGRAENSLGHIEWMSGHPARGVAHYEAALALAREAGDARLVGSVLGNLGNQAELGNMEKARSYNEAALAMARDIGDRRLEGNTLCNLGLMYHVLGDAPQALDHLEASLRVARDIGYQLLECIVLCNLGIVHHSLDHRDDAREHFEAALVLARDSADRRSEGQILGYLALLHAQRGRFQDARHCLDKGETLLREVADRLSLGILLCNFAESELLAGSIEAARTKFAEAEAIAADLSAGAGSELGIALARVGRLIDKASGDKVN
jgi:predicted ATPase/class 3 adenylate cyclase/Tfp pilus assembly protein PilF